MTKSRAKSKKTRGGDFHPCGCLINSEGSTVVCMLHSRIRAEQDAAERDADSKSITCGCQTPNPKARCTLSSPECQAKARKPRPGDSQPCGCLIDSKGNTIVCMLHSRIRAEQEAARREADNNALIFKGSEWFREGEDPKFKTIKAIREARAPKIFKLYREHIGSKHPASLCQAELSLIDKALSGRFKLDE